MVDKTDPTPALMGLMAWEGLIGSHCVLRKHLGGS